MERLKDQNKSAGVAIFCMERTWSAPHNMARALFKEGAQVTVVAPNDSLVAHTKYAHYPIIYDRIELNRVMHHTLCRICKTIQPRIVLPGDDPAFKWLHHLRQLEGVDPDVAALISRSLPSVDKAEILISDSAFVANYSGFLCRPPPFLKSPLWTDVSAFIEQHHLPIVFKKDGLWSGYGVTICRTIQSAREAFDNLSGGSFLVTKFIRGTPAEAAVSGLAGRVCSAFCFKKIERLTENGPACVIEHLQHEAMLSAARGIFEAAELSGFCGIDFIVDEEGRAWLLELTPRMIPASHLGKLFGEDNVKSFVAALNGTKKPPVNKKIMDRVALFPAEISRNLDSPYFYNIFHDVPWDDPKVLKAIISSLAAFK